MDRPTRKIDLRDQASALLDPNGRPIRPEDFAGVRPFSPGEGLVPSMPDAPPRGLVPQVGQNFNLTPRSGWRGRALSAFEQLKTLGDYDLVRVAIEDVKGQIAGMEWDVQPLKEFKNDPQAKEEVRIARAFVEMPDPLARIDFESWISQAVEEMLVTDALSLYPHRDISGRPIGLEQIDGSTIIPLIDDRGRPPIPPSAAYQQVIYGRPETEFTIDDLWYCPFTRRVDNPYGKPGTEQVILTVNLAIRQDLYDLSYYTAGSLPDALYAFPESWTPAQILAYQELWDSVRSGKITSGGLAFIPSGNYIDTKKREWAYDFKEWLGRVIAWAFGVSPLPIMRLIGRNPANALEDSFSESGIRNRAKFIERILNRYIRQVLGLRRAEFAYTVEETEDPTTAYQRDAAFIAIGRKTIDESRLQYGEDPLPGGLGARPFVMIGGAPVLLADAFGAPAGSVTDKASGDAAAAAPSTGATDATARPNAPIAKGAGGVSEVEDALTFWRKISIDRVKAGKRLKPFSSEIIPEVLGASIQYHLTKAVTVEDVIRAFDVGPLKKKSPRLNPTSQVNEARGEESRT